MFETQIIRWTSSIWTLVSSNPKTPHRSTQTALNWEIPAILATTTSNMSSSSRHTLRTRSSSSIRWTIYITRPTIILHATNLTERSSPFSYPKRLRLWVHTNLQDTSRSTLRHLACLVIEGLELCNSKTEITIAQFHLALEAAWAAFSKNRNLFISLRPPWNNKAAAVSSRPHFMYRKSSNHSNSSISSNSRITSNNNRPSHSSKILLSQVRLGLATASQTLTTTTICSNSVWGVLAAHRTLSITPT